MKLNLKIGLIKITSGGTLTFSGFGSHNRANRELGNDYMSMTTCNTRIKKIKNSIIRDLDQQTASSGRSISLHQADIFSVATP